MTMDIDQLAARQLRDYDAHTPGTVFSEGIVLNEAQAYAIQTQVCALRQERGESVVGYKIGCTSAAIRQQLGIDHAVFGRLFSSEQYASGVELSRSCFERPAVEGELGVRLNKRIPASCYEPDRILERIGAVFPVIELHNHVQRGSQAAWELIANNALQAGIVVPPCQFDQVPPNAPVSMRIIIGSKTVAEFLYARWCEVAVRAISELSRLLTSHGLELQAGDIVLTGSLAPLFPISTATSIELVTDKLGVVTASFSNS